MAQEALGGAPPAYAVWIVCTLSRMRLAGTLAQQKEQDMRCRPCGHQLQQPVGWPCGHVCCETCFWNGVRFRLRQGEEICCPICKGEWRHPLRPPAYLSDYDGLGTLVHALPLTKRLMLPNRTDDFACKCHGAAVFRAAV